MRTTVLTGAAKRISTVSSAEGLVSVLSEAMKSEGFNENQFSVEKAAEAKAVSSKLFETKANEVIHTGNTGYGAELIQGAITTSDFLDLAPNAEPGLQFFKGFHGRNMDKTMKVPVLGELGLHDLSAEVTATTSSGPALWLGQPTGKLPTATVQIDQKKYDFQIDVSDEEVRFNIIDLVATLQRKLGVSAARTILATAINGDTTASTANINSLGVSPAATNYYLGANGLRKAAIAATADSIGTLSFANIMGVYADLGENGAMPEDVAYFMDRGTYNKAILLDEFKNQYVNGRDSTIITGAVTNIGGSDVFTNRYIKKSDADGKVDASTPANNTKGTLLAVHNSALQYGFNGDYSIEIFRVPTKGWRIAGYYYAGFATVDSLAASPTDASRFVAGGINITI